MWRKCIWSAGGRGISGRTGSSAPPLPYTTDRARATQRIAREQTREGRGERRHSTTRGKGPQFLDKSVADAAGVCMTGEGIVEESEQQ